MPKNKKPSNGNAGSPQTWKRFAHKHWPHAEFHADGDGGQYALVTFCETEMISLWSDLAAAEKRLHFVNTVGCGSECRRWHRIYDLAKLRSAEAPSERD